MLQFSHVTCNTSVARYYREGLNSIICAVQRMLVQCFDCCVDVYGVVLKQRCNQGEGDRSR